MANIQRGIVQFLQDLDRRARPGRESRNRPLQKFASVSDTVMMTSESVTVEMTTPPYVWADGSTAANRLKWSLGEWAATASVASYYSEVIADSPAAYWRLGESVGTTAADETAGVHHGTYTNGYTLGATGAIVGDANTAVSLNGSTAYVSVPDATGLDLGDVWTLEAWVNPSSLSAVMAIVGKQTGGYLMRTSAAGFLQIVKSQTAVIATATSTCSTGVFNYCVVTKSSATSRIFLNASDVTGAVTNSTCIDNTNPLVIGTDGNGSTASYANFFNGSIDEVAVYGTALSTARIQVHYGKGTGTG